MPPLRDGIVDNWGVLEEVYRHGFANALRGNSDGPIAHPVLAADPPLSSKVGNVECVVRLS